MKICILTHSYPRFSGDWRSNFIESLAHAYHRQGAEVTVFVPLAKQWQRKENERTGVRIVTYRYAPLKAWHVIGYGESMKGDLAMNPLHLLLMPLLLLFGTIRFAILLRRERFDMVQAHWAVPNAFIALLGRALARTPARVFTSFPGSDVTVLVKTGVAGKLMSRLIARSDYLSCNSSDLKEELVLLGIPPQKINYVIYGVNERAIRFDPQKRHVVRKFLGISDREVMLLMVGRFVPKKGFSTGIHAMKELCRKFGRARMVVVGSGILSDEYQHIIAQDGTTDRIKFVGEIKPDMLSSYYSACDIFVMPSERYPSDGLNVVVTEAMSCARPIIASSCGGNDLVVFGGRNGFLHPPKDHEALAQKALMLCRSPRLRTRMGKASRMLVEDRFNWDSLAEYYISRYDDMFAP